MSSNRSYTGLISIASIPSDAFADQVDVELFHGEADPAPVRITVAPEDGKEATAWLTEGNLIQLMAALQMTLERLQRGKGK